jgi:hypothetical protein
LAYPGEDFPAALQRSKESAESWNFMDQLEKALAASCKVVEVTGRYVADILTTDERTLDETRPKSFFWVVIPKPGNFFLCSPARLK